MSLQWSSTSLQWSCTYHEIVNVCCLFWFRWLLQNWPALHLLPWANSKEGLQYLVSWQIYIIWSTPGFLGGCWPPLPLGWSLVPIQIILVNLEEFCAEAPFQNANTCDVKISYISDVHRTTSLRWEWTASRHLVAPSGLIPTPTSLWTVKRVTLFGHQE